jgi:hypothetical protein
MPTGAAFCLCYFRPMRPDRAAPEAMSQAPAGHYEPARRGPLQKLLIGGKSGAGAWRPRRIAVAWPPSTIHRALACALQGFLAVLKGRPCTPCDDINVLCGRACAVERVADALNDSR